MTVVRHQGHGGAGTIGPRSEWMPSQAPDLPVGPALFRLDERVAVITGAGGAFGRATALGCVRAGARVMLTDIDASALEETARLVAGEGECRVLAGDSSQEAFVHATFA